MNNIQEAAVWRRVAGKTEALTEEGKLMSLYNRQMQGTYSFLYLANHHENLAPALRQIAASKAQCASILASLYFFKTGKKLLPPTPALALSENLPTALTEHHAQAEEDLQFFASNPEYRNLAAQTEFQCDKMLQIVAQNL